MRFPREAHFFARYFRKAMSTKDKINLQNPNFGIEYADTLKQIYNLSLICAVLSAPAGVASMTIFNHPEWAISESGCLEIAQAVILAVALIFYAVALFHRGEKDEKMITLFFAVLTYAFILREVDFDKMGLPAPLVFMLYGKGRTITLVLGFAMVLLGSLIQFKTYMKSAFKFIFSTRGFLITSAAALLWIGYFFEHHSGLETTGELLEELCELAGYCLILSSALKTEMRARTTARQ